MTTVAHCTSIDHAFLLRSLLEDCGIAAFVPDELNVQLQPFLFSPLNNIRLQVADENIEAARAILTENGHTPVS
jgi:hypothetical protein